MSDEITEKPMREWAGDTFPRKGGSGSGTAIGYSVEARMNYHAPLVIGDFAFDTRWRRVHTSIVQSAHGAAPEPHYKASALKDLSLLTWEQANAIRWQLMCIIAQRAGSNLCVETRIVEHKVTYSYAEEIIAAYDPFGGDAFGGGTHPRTKPHWPKASP